MVERVDESIDELLDDLEFRAREQHAGSGGENFWVCQRRHPRCAFRVGCNIFYLLDDEPFAHSLMGRTRNLSRSGVGLLVRREFRSGEPVEVELLLPERPNMFVAGLVTFCRYAGQGYYEIGISLQGASTTPVFSHNPRAAAAHYPWLRGRANVA